MSNFKSLNGIKVADGDLRHNVAPEFDPYYYSGNVGDIRLHDNQLYKCIESTTGGAPWDASQWKEITLEEEIVNLNRGVRDINNKFPPAGTQALSFTPRNCTGNVNGVIRMSVSSDKSMLNIRGHVWLNSFVRTGPDPGFDVTLPFLPAYNWNADTIIGYRGEYPREVVYLIFGQEQTHAVIATTEHFQNAANGTLTFVIPSTVIPLPTW